MRKHEGFSLIIVLIIAMVGMAFVGVVLSTLETFSSASRSESRSTDTYNVLSAEIEKAKAVLKEGMITSTAPLTRENPGAKITSLDQLVVYKGNAPLWDIEETRKIGAHEADLFVKIYTMNYDVSDIDPSKLNDYAFTKRLPPIFELKTQGSLTSDEDMDTDSTGATTGKSASAGVYLIRATLDFGDDQVFTIETSVTQNIG
jgi:hypothetical protein